MRRYEVVEKMLGETPLQALDELRRKDRTLATVPLTYAGRLDPLARGKLLVLIGEECKRRARYDKLDKTYVFEVLLGFKSDTGDIMGFPEEAKERSTKSPSEKDIAAVARSLIATHTLPYPAYSSKTVNGKPLFQHALENSLEAIEIPNTEITIYSCAYIDRLTIPKNRLIECMLDTIGRVKYDNLSKRPGADFRIPEICTRWWALRSKHPSSCTILRFEATVSAGTYIRSVAPLIAERLGTVGLAYSIERTRMGRYIPLGRFFGFWLHTF